MSAQFEKLHKNGSSHGGSRITRRLYVQKHFAEMMSEVRNAHPPHVR